MSLPHPQVYSFEGVVPVIDPSAYVHPSAVLIGDVIVGAGCYVAPGAVLRGDFGRIVLGREANLQDNCVVHSLPDFDCVMDERSHIGHGAVIHGCHIGRDALIGMNAVILDRARVGEQSIVAAMALVKMRGEVPPRTLVGGVPARVMRELTDDDLRAKQANTDSYVRLAQRCRPGIARVTALQAPEPDRPRTRWDFLKTL